MHRAYVTALFLVCATAAAGQDFAPADMTGMLLTLAGFEGGTFAQRNDGSFDARNVNGLDLEYPAAAAGGYSYTKTGAASATFFFWKHPNNLTYRLTFTAANGGTYTADRGPTVPGAGSGVFTLVKAPLLLLANTSSRVHLAAGASAILGVVVQDSGLSSLTIRAAGPALRAFGISAPLADPKVAVYRDGMLVAANDNWSAERPAFSKPARDADLGAFPFAVGSKDAEVFIDAPGRGNYTVVVESADGTEGDVLIEAYGYR